MKNQSKDISVALARAVASRKVPAEIVSKISAKLSESTVPIRGIDICAYGICIDYIVDRRDWWDVIPSITTLTGSRMRSLRLFPWGIPVDDIFHIRVEHEFEELAPFMGQAR